RIPAPHAGPCMPRREQHWNGCRCGTLCVPSLQELCRGFAARIHYGLYFYAVYSVVYVSWRIGDAVRLAGPLPRCRTHWRKTINYFGSNDRRLFHKGLDARAQVMVKVEGGKWKLV